MTPKFLPTSLDSVSPTIDLETVINRVTGPGPHDYSLYKNYSDDSLLFKIDGKMMTIAEAAPRLKKTAAKYEVSAGIVLDALQQGALNAYVMRAQDSTFWQIPRFYFNRKKIGDLALAPFTEWEPDTSGEHDTMYGNPVLVSERHFEQWLERLRSSNESEPIEPAEPNSSRDRRPGHAEGGVASTPSGDQIAWASDAAARKVPIRDARKDALNRLGAAAPKEEVCRELLRTAMSATGVEVKPGRRPGSKSHWNKEN